MIKLIIPALMFITACSQNIIDRDFEQEEADYIKAYGEAAAKDPLWQNPTPQTMLLTDVDDVSVTIHKTHTDDDEGIMLQSWSATVANHNDDTKCVNISWKLQGFRMINDHAGFIIIKPKETILNYVTLKQTIWDPNGLRIALPPSGYIGNMVVQDPIIGANNLDELCDFYESEDNIVEL